MPIDYSKYPPNWKTEIRPRILNRANNCCEECSLENGVTALSYKENGITQWVNIAFEDLIEHPYKEVKVVLTIAHLDHDETNHNVTDERLKAMCQLCHLRYDAKEKVIRKQNRSITANACRLFFGL